MNPEVKEMWMNALNSEEYKQTGGTLKETRNGKVVGYCCLGVLCDLAIKAGAVEGLAWGATAWGADGFHDILETGEHGEVRRTAGMPPFSVYQWAGLDEDNAMFLADLNDATRASFGTIAKVIGHVL